MNQTELSIVGDNTVGWRWRLAVSQFNLFIGTGRQSFATLDGAETRAKDIACFFDLCINKKCINGVGAKVGEEC